MKLTHLALVAGITTLSVSAFAQVPFGVMHEHFDPRQGRVEIENRLHHQGERIFRKLRAGVISQNQAAVLRGEDDQVRHQLHMMEARHDGFLSPEDRMMLNHRLDEISRQIGI